ncbi:MAG: hypothetical protein K2P90_00075 [Holosporales bacterium]|nr:hypothetical protein [Holosporales bacterium]
MFDSRVFEIFHELRSTIDLDRDQGGMAIFYALLVPDDFSLDVGRFFEMEIWN